MSSWFSELTAEHFIPFWFLIEFLSIIVVTVGCGLEAWAIDHAFSDWLKTAPKSSRLLKKRTSEEVTKLWEFRFGCLVVMGLAIELIAFGFSFIASSREIEGLKSSNMELKLKIQPRNITAQQEKDFIFLTGRIPKISIKIHVGLEGGDTLNFAGQFRQMFDAAGFPRDASTAPLGLTRDSENIVHTTIWRPIGVDEAWASVFYVTYGTNNIKPPRRMAGETTNGFFGQYWAAEQARMTFMMPSRYVLQRLESKWNG